MSKPRFATLQASLLNVLAGYRRWISPLLPPACRFHPTCSQYASEAIASHGAAHGLLLAAKRLSRCHPWCDGGVDPVPPPHTTPDRIPSDAVSMRTAGGAR